MPLDNLSGLLDGLVTTDASAMPPAFARRVTRRRWMRRAILGGAPVVAIVACLTAVVMLHRPEPAPDPVPHPTPIAQAPAPKVFGDNSFATLSRAGLSAPALQDIPAPRTGQTFAPVRAEPPLRAFDVARVLRGL
jgi:hypothetical protein